MLSSNVVRELLVRHLILPPAYDVEVPVGTKIQFPQGCAVCRNPSHGESIEIQSNPVGYWGLWKWELGLNSKLPIPAHSRCGEGLRGSLVFRQLALLAIGLMVLGLAIWLDWGKVELFGILLIALSPPIFWQLHNPLLVGLTNDDGLFTFTFRERQYAEEFTQLNASEVLSDDA